MSEKIAKAWAVGAALFFLICAGLFASGQSIWVDETTQLQGLTLPIGEQFLWLTGQGRPELGVPADRMPPLSYWLGIIWSSLFGLSENSLRAFGVLAVLSAMPALYASGRRISGSLGGAFLVAALCSAPGLIIMAGEIRTYPVFFALSVWGFRAYVGAIFAETVSERNRWFWWLAAFSILMSYAHFFGVVASCCLFGGLALHQLLHKRSLWLVLEIFAVVALTWVGLIPFIQAAMAISGETNASSMSFGDAIKDILRFVIRLFVDPVFLANRPALLLLGLALGFLAVLLLIRLVRTAPQVRRAGLALLAPAAAAIGGLGLLSLVISGFEVLRPSYSIWLLPVLFGSLTFALSQEERSPWLRGVPILAMMALVSGHLMAAGTLLRHNTLYSHGAGEWLAAQIDRPEVTLIIHDDADAWGHSYFPLRFLEGPGLTQVVRGVDADYTEFANMRVMPIPDISEFQAGFEAQYRVHTFPLSGAARAAIVRGETTCARSIGREVKSLQPFERG